MSVIENQIKVTYLTFDGYTTQAYVNEETLVGESKHTDAPVALAWSDELDGYMQISNNEEDHTITDEPVEPAVVKKGQRWQPKSRKRSSTR